MTLRSIAQHAPNGAGLTLRYVYGARDHVSTRSTGTRGPAPR
jgi:hypothetical protein